MSNQVNCFYVDGVNEHQIELIVTQNGLVSKIGNDEDFWILNIAFSNIREIYSTDSALAMNGDTKVRLKMSGGSFEELVFENEKQAKIFMNKVFRNLISS